MAETIDTPQPFPHVIVDGEPRYLACLPPRDDFGGRPLYAAAHNVIPRSAWVGKSLAAWLGPVLNQGSHGSCVGHGTDGAFHATCNIAGVTVPDSGFSPTFIYAQINGGRDAGAVVSDAMEELTTIGTCTMAECGENTIYKRQIPASAYETAKRFRAVEAYHCSTFDEMVSALLRGFFVVFGITIRSPFQQRIPSTGIIEPGGFPIGGHCMFAYGVVRLPDGRWAVLVRNSWGDTWGVNGNCILPEGHFPDGMDAFALMGVQSDPKDPHPAPVAVIA